MFNKKKKDLKSLVDKSGLFDKKYYLKRNQDVRLSDSTPIEHYIKYGIREDRKPNEEFDPIWYREFYKDVRIDGAYPIVHFILHGLKENRFISEKEEREYSRLKENRLFNEEFYKEMNEDLRGLDVSFDLLLHYVRFGKNEGRQLGPNLASIAIEEDEFEEKGMSTFDVFDEKYYLKNNPDVEDAGMNAFDHYINQGWKEGRAPNDWFDPSYYLEKYKDIREAGIEPLTHYLDEGKIEGRSCKHIRHISIKSYFSYLNKQNIKDKNNNEYIDFKENSTLNLDLKLIAFYLPQFHPIAENDHAWGKGFTEWTNVSKALPQFEDHYQPRLPGELGYYDLRLIDVQKRQIELAKNYGLYGFCYHYYWFGGKKALEKPLEQLLAHPELDFPFCINWANENWTKRWDGRNSDVIFEQTYSENGDIEFIEEVSIFFMDKRYIRIDGKPLLMIYRPIDFPDIKSTAKRWREWCLKNSIGEIYLVLTHSFEHIDPRELGFDAAVEFAPNSFPVKPISNNLEYYNKNSEITAFDYKELIKISDNFIVPEYIKFRALCPSWDNEARKPGKGTVFHNASPYLYGKWLDNLSQYTAKSFKPSEQLLFINAWNEWGEGAYIEPDRKYGYNYLETTYNVLSKYNQKKKIIYVSHDAHFHGAQLLSLNIIRVLHDMFNLDVHMILKVGGTLESEFKKYATVYNLEDDYPSKDETKKLIKSLYASGAENAICNTVVSGDIVKLLSKQGIQTISLIHELPTLIKNYKMEENALMIAEFADHVIFPSHFVKDGFLTVTDVDETKSVVSPQGLYQINHYQDNIDEARIELRKQLELTPDAKIVLGTGFADHRKGIDIFIDVALNVSKQSDNIYFVWVGDVEQTMQKYISETFEFEGSNVIFVPAQPEIALYYSGADIYLMTSREDPFPSVVMEAMNAKVPVIGFRDAGGFQDIVTEDRGILVAYENTNEMTDAVLMLLKDEEKWQMFGENSSELIREEFVWKDYIYRLLELVGMPYKKVSVVVPNYNYEKYIESRLKTVEAQEYPVYELLYLEDCSPDNSLEIAKSFQAQTKADMKIIENEVNSGSVFKQWAKGINLAKGDYIWIAEADDLASSDFLTEVMKGFDDREVVLSYAQSKQIDQDSKLLNETYLDYTNDISTEKWKTNYIRNGVNELTDTLVVKNTIPNVSGVVFKKFDISPILENLLTFKVGGDWYFYVYLLKQGKIAYNAKPLNSHRRHTASVTTSPENDKKHFQEIVDLQELIKEDFDVSDAMWEEVLKYRKKVKDYLNIEVLN